MARRIAKLALALLIFAGSTELGLRLVPQAIPVKALRSFEPALRSEIAARRSLQRIEDTVLVPRNDGGPPSRMWLYKPGATIQHDFQDEGALDRVQMDALGFCNPPPGEAPERIEVAALGDSFTWCTAVAPSETWPSQLQDRAERRTYNFGIPGRGLHEHLQMFERFGLPMSPRFVVMNVYEGNDLRDASHFHQGRADSGAAASCPYLWPSACSAHRRFLAGALGRHSYAANLAAAGLWRAAYDRNKLDVDFRYTLEFPDGTRHSFNAANSDRDEVRFAYELRDGGVDLSLFDDALLRFQALGREHGFTALVVFTPSAHDAYRDVVRFEDPALGPVLSEFGDAQRAYFEARCRELGIAYLDLTPALRREAAARGPDELLYFPWNVHFTAAGHAVVATELTRALNALEALGGS